MKILFKIREFAWVVADEIADWLYPYHNRLTPEEQFEIRVKDPMSGENFMVEEHIQQQNERIERLQDEMITVQMKLAEHEERFKTRIKIKKSSSSVSGEIKNIFNS
jgi:disulfide oxidoreductase YuzD